MLELYNIEREILSNELLMWRVLDEYPPNPFVTSHS